MHTCVQLPVPDTLDVLLVEQEVVGTQQSALEVRSAIIAWTLTRPGIACRPADGERPRRRRHPEPEAAFQGVLLSRGFYFRMAPAA